MPYRQSLLTSAAAAAALVLLAAWLGSAPSPAAASTTPPGAGQLRAVSMARSGPSCLTAEGQAAQCCLTHPGYAGVCVVEPAKDETCATVLRYLNDPQSQGKTYCNNSSLRGGWKLVACKATPTAD